MRTGFRSVTAVVPIALAALAYAIVVPVTPARATPLPSRSAPQQRHVREVGDTAITTMDGVYTLAQATRGGNVFAAYCKSCHTPTFHSGPPFRAKWYGRSLVDLFVYVRREMPKNAPGSMSDADYTLAIAYLLRINGMPTGAKPLAADTAELRRIRLDSVPAASSPEGPAR
ncbi:MAG: cytochrome c [Gemmatimonadaceae bacterium]|nr:cytochrome c [Gemmatimonadaceae bacterium]